MYSVIVDHALKHVWAAPLQDYEHTILPARLTPEGGWLRYANVIWNNRIPLPHAEDPTFQKRYHVYQIGKYPDFLLGVAGLKDEWINLNTIMERTDCFVHCFIDNGVTVKAHECWLRLLKPSNNIVLAVQIDHTYSLGTSNVEDPVTGVSKIVPNRLDFKQLYIRFYTNALLHDIGQRQKVHNPADQVRGYSKFCTSVGDVNAFLAAIDDPTRPKFGWLRLDGYVYSREYIASNPFLAVNKNLYSYHDDTIIGTYWHKLSDLKSFTSMKHRGKNKFIMFYGRDQKCLIFHNDVEYFLGVKRSDQFRGIYVPRFDEVTVNNITHGIHSLDTNVILDLQENNFEWMTNPDELYIMSVVRQGGTQNGLTYQHSRISELYRLTDEQILQALQDRNSVMPEWTAANLEVDPYAQLMEADREAVTPELVMQAYGYNAITKYMHPQVLKTVASSVPGASEVELSPIFINPSRVMDQYMPIEVIQYDKAGLKIDVSRHLFPANGYLYFPKKPSGKLVDKIEYYFNDYKAEKPFRLLNIYETQITDSDLMVYGFNAYVCPLVNGKPNYNWVDVTGSEYYIFNSKAVIPVLTWDEGALARDGLVCMTVIPNESSIIEGKWSDIKHLDRDYAIVKVLDQLNGHKTLIAGQIDVWLDGRLLFEDLDYIVRWPEIVIFKKLDNYDVEYSVRISGTPNPITKKNWKPFERGFVKDGILSKDSKYQTRDDHNKQINVGGMLRHESEVSFAEDPAGVLVQDGLPFAVRDYVTPIEFYTGHSTLVEKKRSLEVDGRVNDYLTLHLPDNPPRKPTVVYKRWHVVSVFFNEILKSLQNGWLASELEGNWNNTDVDAWLSNNLGLLEVDVTTSTFLDKEYVEVLAHGNPFTLEVTSNQMRFLKILNRNYLGDAVELEKYLYIDVNKG